MSCSAATKRGSHRVALVTATFWWGYVFFSTSFFTNLSGAGLVVYMNGIARVFANFRS